MPGRAYDAGIEPLLCLTKADLAGPETVLDYYTELELPYLLIRPDSSLDALRSLLTGRVSVLVGHSGVGKSTLVNRLVPEAERAVGTVSAIGRGRHTSTSAVALRLPAPPDADPDPGWIVDTPGVRSFGLAHVSAESLLHGFSDLVEATADCPANCPHTPTRPTAHSTPGWRPGGPTRAGWPRTAGCWPPAPGRPTNGPSPTHADARSDPAVAPPTCRSPAPGVDAVPASLPCPA